MGNHFDSSLQGLGYRNLIKSLGVECTPEVKACDKFAIKFKWDSQSF